MSFSMISSENLCFISFAGTHQTIAYGGTDLVTTEYAAMIAHCHIVIHDMTLAQVQIHTSSHTSIPPLL
jgi:hypothetical protein